MILPLAMMLLSSASQGVLDHGPDVLGPWTPPIGVVTFTFTHRFSSSPAPERKVTSFPTFLIATGLPRRMVVGARYATNSTLRDRYPNEWEFFGGATPLAESRGDPVDLGVTASWNLAAQGPGAELTVARAVGHVRLLGVGRIMAEPGRDGADLALGGGLVWRLTRHLALAGDVVSLLPREAGEHLAWSTGVQLALPGTPHTLSLHLSNTATTTMQSGSRGGRTVRFGFEFTIPITLARYFGRRPPVGSATVARDSVVMIHVRDLAYSPSLLDIPAGTTVVWINDDQVDHTVSSEDATIRSGVIPPGGRWSHRFDSVGVVRYACTPHPFMHGEIRVVPRR